jgi:trehalose synthase
LTSEEKRVYLETVEETASNMVPEAKADVWILHDPQLLPLVAFVDGLAPKISFWVCHIDLSHPNKDVLAELMPLTAPYNGLVFSSASYVPADLNGIPVSIIPPTIDPLVPKNISMDIKEAQGIMERLGLDTSRPVVTQVSRFDLWKDPIGVIEAYRMAKQEVPDLQLVLMGVIEAQDDPEAKLVL